MKFIRTGCSLGNLLEMLFASPLPLADRDLHSDAHRTQRARKFQWKIQWKAPVESSNGKFKRKAPTESPNQKPQWKVMYQRAKSRSKVAYRASRIGAERKNKCCTFQLSWPSALCVWMEMQQTGLYYRDRWGGLAVRVCLERGREREKKEQEESALGPRPLASECQREWPSRLVLAGECIRKIWHSRMHRNFAFECF